MLDKKIRLPRVEREESITIQEDENQHLWAVSYADFLMALLAFFILFFSMDEAKREDLIQNIAVQFEGGASSEARLPAAAPDFSTELSKVLKLEHLQTLQSQRSLTIFLPDNFYRPGQFELHTLQKDSLGRLLTALKPYAGSLEIYFEGHADPDPLVRAKSRVIKDNYVLSSLRASSALQFAKESGFQEKDLFIAATGSNGRGTRTLSLRLQARRDQK